MDYHALNVDFLIVITHVFNLIARNFLLIII
jgi:hypothetical protein